LNTFQLPRIIADKIENTSIKIFEDRERWWVCDCAMGEKAEELGLPMNPYYACSLIREYKSQIDFWKQYDLGFFNKYIRQRGRMIRAHVTMHDPNPEKFGIPHNYHIDQEIPHIVALYYVNDADGDTFFVDEHDHSKIIHRETPKKGKCVVFEGLHAFHASSSPSKNIRMTLNINYEII
tara:strand:+ start:149 stop:685 length:537 start_codon:yes stop_codon:yes gene_type:complete